MVLPAEMAAADSTSTAAADDTTTLQKHYGSAADAESAGSKEKPAFSAMGPSVPKKVGGKASEASIAAAAKPVGPAPKSKLPPVVEHNKQKQAAAKQQTEMASSSPGPLVVDPAVHQQVEPREPAAPATPAHVALDPTPVPPPSMDNMAGWTTHRSDDGVQFYFHEASRTTALHTMGRAEGARALAVDGAPWAAPPQGPGIASAAGDPLIAWSAADWDIVLVLPLPEDASARAEEHHEAQSNAKIEAASQSGDKYDEYVERTRQKELAAKRAKAAKRAEKEAAEEAKRQAKAAAQRAKRASALASSSDASDAGEGEEGEDYVNIDSSEMKLRSGLQLAMQDAPCDGTGECRSSNAWLIKELRRRVLGAGLQCKVVKLLPCPDDLSEEPGEYEVDSGHCVTLVCIGAAKTTEDDEQQEWTASKQMTATGRVASMADPPPSPPPGPPGGDGSETNTEKQERARLKQDAERERAERKAELKRVAAEDKEATRQAAREAKAKVKEKQLELRDVKREASREVRALKQQRLESRKDLHAAAHSTGRPARSPRAMSRAAAQRERERFPRLELEVERRQLRLQTRHPSGLPLPGPRALYHQKAHARFPPFRSALRIDLIHSILEAPLEAGRGAGLKLHELCASGRLLEVIYVHDDDEVEDVKRTLVYGSAGVWPLSAKVLGALHAYTGAEVGFYFAWVSAYTRSLWFPALLGAILWYSDASYFTATLDAERNMSRAEVDRLIAAGETSAGFQRAVLQMLFGLCVILWSSGFDEMWKRRQATVAIAWGELGTDQSKPSLNPTFKPSRVRNGFYTSAGLWVSLEPSKGSKQHKGSQTDTPPRMSQDKSGRLALLSSMPKAVTKPKDLWFSSAERLKRQYASAIVTCLMSLGCLFAIFSMQLFSSWARQNPLALGGMATTWYSISNAVMITVFNVGWRNFALFLCTWENYRLKPRYRKMLTYKLFIFQCINCYFTLLYTAFFKPFGVQLFGVDMGKCEVRPLVRGEPSCADEVRELLYSILFANILVGQATEVGLVVFGIFNKRIVSAIKNYLRDRKEKKEEKAMARQKTSKVQPADEADTASSTPGELEAQQAASLASTAAARGPSLETIARKRRAKQALTPVEERLYADQCKVVDIIGEFERPLVKSEKQGLGSTFYEYNELALQYGYLVFFSILLPAAPVLALANNLIEVRTDALKTIYASRRTRAEAASDIGPWSAALRVLSFLGLACNLALLAVTSDFFDQLAVYAPWFETTGARLGTVIFAEHILLGLKLLIDFVVPDVPTKVKVRLEREEFVCDAQVASQVQALVTPR